MLQTIRHNDQELAIIIKADYQRSGISFFTPNEYSQQLAYMQYPQGKVIPAHTHNPITRKVRYTNEVLFIRKGKLRVDFFTDNHEYIKSVILSTGDVILLSGGGHGFEALAELEMIEVKQGPYAGDTDKTRFEGTIREYVF